jgi:hypothetical protein
MIFQPRGSGLLAVTQPDHGRLAGHIAEAWGGEAWRPGPWEPLVLAAHQHDDGWLPWEEAPALLPDGRPVDFLTLPTAERVDVYRRSVDIVAPRNLYAGLLTSLHVTGLFLGRYQPGNPRAIDLLSGRDRELVERFVAEQEAWRAGVLELVDAPDLTPQYELLQVFDMLSLMLCMRPGEELEGLNLDRVPLGPGEAPGPMAVHRAGDTLVLEPWPLASACVTVGVDARYLPARRFPDVASYRSALRDAPVERLRFVLASGG